MLPEPGKDEVPNELKGVVWQHLGPAQFAVPSQARAVLPLLPAREWSAKPCPGAPLRLTGRPAGLLKGTLLLSCSVNIF